MFNAIMGVGREPQVTQDIVTNPYLSTFTDIAPYGIVSYSHSGTLALEIGTPQNTINTSVDINEQSYYYQTPDGGDDDFTIIWDLGKVCDLRRISFNMVILEANGYNDTDRLQVSRDGVNYVNVGTRTGNTTTATGINEIFEANYTTARFIKLTRSMSSLPGATVEVALYKFVATLDNVQRLS